MVGICSYFLPTISLLGIFFFFFFQAEDGIRDLLVTGVQTCALPIYTDSQSLRQGLVRYAPLGVVVALIVFAEIGYVVYSREMGVSFGTPLPHGGDFSNTRELGQAIYTAYGFPFEIAGVILLVGIVAAIMLTLRRRQGVRHQNIAKQVWVNAKRGRVRIVHMPSESRPPEKNP